MSLTVILVTVTLITLLILTQKTDLRIKKGEKLTVTADLTFFSIEFTDGGKSKKKRKRKGRLPVRAIIKALRRLLPSCDVNIRRLRLADTSALAEKRGVLYSFVSLSALLVLVKSEAKSFVYTDSAYLITQSSVDPEDAPYIDVLIVFPLHSLIIFALFFLYYLAEPRLKRKGKNVG